MIDIIPYAFRNKLDRSGRIRDKDEIIMFWISAKKSKGLYSNGVNSVACYSRRCRCRMWIAVEITEKIPRKLLYQRFSV